MARSKNTAAQPETQWAGRLITLACEHGFKDLVRYGIGGQHLMDEFNRICVDKKMRNCESGNPGDFAVWIDYRTGGDAPTYRDKENIEEDLEALHYHGSRGAFLVFRSTFASLDWWTEQLEVRFEIIEIEDDGNFIICLARPLSLVGSITTKGAVAEEDRSHQVRLNCKYFPQRLGPPKFTGQRLPSHGRTAMLAAAGPSIRNTWPDFRLAAGNPEVDIISCSVGYRILRERDITPYAHVDCDPRPHKAQQVLPIDTADVTRFWLASCVAENWQDYLEPGRVWLWHAHNGPESVRVKNEVDPDHGMICGGGSVGLRSICLLYFLGYDRILVHGLDCSFDAETGEQHATKHLGKKKDEIEIRVAGRKFLTSPIMVAYARYFVKMLDILPGADIQLAGDGLLQAMCGKR